MRLSTGIQFGICGSSSPFDEGTSRQAQTLGKIIALDNNIVMTGGCWGLSYDVVTSANIQNGVTIGFSPAANRTEHISKYRFPTDFSVLIFTGFGYKGRNVITIRSADIVIFLPGGIGTLNEFTIALDEGKLIGILGNELVLKQIPEILKICGKNTDKIIYEEDPNSLVEKLIRKYRETMTI